MECVLLLVVLLDLACSVFTTQEKPGSTLQMEFPNSPEGHHPATMSSFFPAVSFSPSSRDNMVKTSQVESSTLILPSLSKADVKGKLPSVKSELGVKNSKTEDYVQRIETELTPKVTFSRSASLTQTSVSPTSEVTASTSSVLSQVSGVGASSGLFQMQVASSHLQNNNATATLSTVRVEGRSTLMLTQGLSAINEQNVVTASKIIQSTTTSLQFSASGRDSLSLESKGSQGSLASLASDVSSNVARMSTVQIDLGQSQAQISRSASSSVLHVVTLSSLLPVQSLTTWKPSLTQSKVANTSIPSRSVSVHKMSHSSSHMAQSGMVISPTNQSVHPILSASAPVSRFIHGMKAESSSSHLQDVSLIFNTSQVSTLPMTRCSVPKSTHTSSEKSLYSIGMSSASIKMPNSSESVSYKKIDPTTTYAPVSMTSWYPSSSVFLLPPTAVPGKPDAPVIQSVKVLSANRVYLKWNATNIQSFVNFSIDFSQDAVAWVQATCNNSLVQAACVVNQTEAVVFLLEPFTNYTFRVMAKSRFGNSNYSLESQWVLTGEAAPSGSPVITTAHNVSSTEIVVAWKPPPLQTLNGKLRSYEVQITELKGTPTSLPTEVTVSSSSSSFGSSAHVSYPTREPHMLTTAAAAVEGIQQVGVPVSLDAKLNLSIHIAELKKWSNYLVRVRAHTVAAGPFSDAVVVRTDEDAPTGPPRNVRALTISSSSISLFWMPPEPEEQNGPITGYSIFVKGDSESTKHFKVTAGMMAYNASGLRPYTNFTFQMQALNVMGVGPNSSTVMNATFQAAPTGPPRNVRALTVSSSSISLFWMPPEPEEQNGPITGYSIFVKGDSEPKKHFKVAAGMMAYNATGLRPYTNYTFQMQALNVMGVGPNSSTVMNATFQAAPTGPPRNVRALTVSSSSISLYWMPPQPEEQNGPITGYNIFVKGDGEPKKHFKVTAGMMAYNATGLRPYTNYTFQMQALNVMGVGPNSSTVMNTTFQAAPTGPPLNVRALTISSASISLFWMPPEPEEQKGPITGYSIFVKGDSESTKHFKVAAGLMAYNATGLRPYTNYTFQMHALNVMGVGPNSSTVMNATFQAAPTGPPRNVRALTISSSSISLYWTPPEPEEQNGLITGYNIFVKGDSEPTKHFKVTAGMMAYNATGLRPYTNYTFQMQAFNVMGVGPYSSTVMNTTFQAAPTGAPRNVRALAISSSSISLYWMPPEPKEQNGPITGYSIFVNVVSEPTKHFGVTAYLMTVRVAAYMMAYNFTDLRPYTKYTFRVQAVNDMGFGPYSNTLISTTFEAVPSPPRNVTAQSLNSTAIKVTWDEALHPNGIISYKVYKRRSVEKEDADQQIYDGLDTVYIAAGLEEYVKYTFTVVSLNVKYQWTSQRVIAMETTHPTEPSGPPQNVRALALSPTSIRVIWNPPLLSQRNGIISHYTVRFKSEIHQPKSVNTIGNNTSIVISDLAIFTTYSFTIKAWNVIGAGPESQAVDNTTWEDLPTAPQDLRAWNLSESSVFVTWREPSHVNGNLKRYEVYYKPVSGSNFMSREVEGKTTQVTLHFLTPFTLYNVKVLAVTGAGGGNASAVTVTTDETVPSAPQDLRAWNLSESSVFVTWREPSHVNGNLKGYKVYYKPASESKFMSREVEGKTTRVTLHSLISFTLYNVKVIAVTGAGGGNASAVTVTTDETAPSHDIQLKVLKFDSRSIELSWTPPSRRNGKIGYFLSYWKFQGSFLPRQDLKSVRLPGKITSKVVRELKPYSEYKFEIVAYNLRKNSNASAPNIALANTTAEEPSGPPRNVRIINTTSDSITLSWDPPLEPNGKILGYKVKYFEKGKPDKDVNDHLKENVYIITALKPYRFYKIHVACRSSGGIGPASPYVEQQTKAGEPPPLGTLAPPDKRSIKSNSFIVRLTKASNEMGEVKYYQVIVRELATDNKNKPVPLEEPDSFKPKDLYTYDEARRRKPKLVPYIAAQFPAGEFDLYENFVVGAGSKGSSEAKRRRRRRRVEGDSQEYYNGPLEENTYYAVFQRAYVSEDVYSSSDWTEPVTTAAIAENKDPPSSTPIGMIVGLILVIVIVALLILVVIYFVRRKRGRFDRVLDDRDDFTNGQPVKMKKLSRKRKSIQKKLMGSIESLNALEDLAASRAKRQPVPIDDFERHVSRMHMDGDHGFSEEYSLVQPDEEFSFQQFLNPANKYKNRYANIVAYDHTRVLLNPLEGVAGSDYINANFIDGYNRQRAYIAAQGPLMETFDDFWRMIWEQMSSVIVMLTKLEERGRRKCDQYWPERGTKSHGQIQVTLKETLNMSHYTLRKFIIAHKQFPDDDRLIKQFHFTAWPDHGVPSHPTPLLSLVRHSYNANRQSVGPMVVHCSAGVGRTGTFITLDVMLQRISQEDSIDVFGFVRQMRYQRNFMVQTEAQYVFIHDAVLEAITCGVTEVEAKDLSFRIRELRQFDPETGYTYMENEFSRLAKEENHPIAFKSATLNCNAAKNRYANILPFESTRVHLKMRPGEMGSDYINANFIDGYCQPRAYIATQAPIPDTFEDFWRLIWEQESATVVMLTREEEAGKIKCHHYWPTEGSRLYGVILVELIEETSFGDYFSRKFKLTHTEEKDSHTVCQFHYTDWPDIGVPDSGVGIVDLIGQVQKWQQHSGNTSIVIHCSGGVGRTGVFCGISMMIERLKSEGVVDVFQTVQAMRLQRPAMVQTAEQYDFCYTTLQEYLDSFDLYANFQ
ncbi:receptor-type tyrosine-protein phosphatase delta-like isoform X6 [Acropora muricata]|uniref:receptor-type tyrosine-protein phosphatase delta-like isoform X6 n=1 Tax=Acropora muricata TaxID=159855 RepID=UPI0034E55F24